jgi:hypothetical protein
MIHSEKEVLDWLLDHCEHDRVLYNALTNHTYEPSIAWMKSMGRWSVLAVTPIKWNMLHVLVVPHSVTGEPHHYYRANEHADS